MPQTSTYLREKFSFNNPGDGIPEAEKVITDNGGTIDTEGNITFNFDDHDCSGDTRKDILDAIAFLLEEWDYSWDQLPNISEGNDSSRYRNSLPNMYRDPISVRHQDLERASEESIFRSKCPQCKTGTLFVQRNTLTMLTQAEDICGSCGQQYVYTDIKPAMGLEYREDVP